MENVYKIAPRKYGPSTRFVLIDANGRALTHRFRGRSLVQYFETEDAARAYATLRMFTIAE